MNKKITDLAKKFAELKTSYEAANKALGVLAQEWTDIETQLLDAMVEEGVNGVDVVGVGSFAMRAKNFLSVTIANKPQFFQYLRLSGNGALLKEDVNPRTLTSFLGEHLEELIQQKESEGKDMIQARDEALEYLNKQGASYHTKREISMKRN